MQLIDLDTVMRKADAIYAAKVAAQCGVNLAYAAPETLPRIESRQVRAVAEALVGELNVRLEALSGWEAARKPEEKNNG